MTEETTTRDETEAVTISETIENTSEEAVTTKEEKTQEEPGYKVFVGNLAFQTSEEQLSEFF